MWFDIRSYNSIFSGSHLRSLLLSSSKNWKYALAYDPPDLGVESIPACQILSRWRGLGRKKTLYGNTRNPRGVVGLIFILTPTFSAWTDVILEAFPVLDSSLYAI